MGSTSPLLWEVLAPDLDTRDAAQVYLYGTHILEKYWMHSKFKNKPKAKGSKELQYRTKSGSGVMRHGQGTVPKAGEWAGLLNATDMADAHGAN